MAWRTWDRTTRIAVPACILAALLCIALIWALATGWPDRRTDPPPPTTPAPTTTTSPSPATPPTPTPTWTCSHATGPSCTADQAAKETAYRDAEAAYRAYHKELDKALRAGGGTTVPAALASLVSGPSGKQLASDLEGFHDDGLVMTGATRIASLEVATDSPHWPTDEIVFDVCTDATDTTFLERATGRFVANGRIARSRAVMRNIDQGWVLWSQQQEVVPEC